MKQNTECRSSLSSPPSHIAVFGKDLRDAVVESVHVNTDGSCDIANEWLEKIRRFCSLYGRRLGAISSSRFGKGKKIHLTWMMEVLLVGARNHSYKGSAPLDSACLNAALFCGKALGNDYSEPLQEAVDELREWLVQQPVEPTMLDAQGAELQLKKGRWSNEASLCKDKLILISPNPYSLFSIAVLEICQRIGLPIGAVVIRKISTARFVDELTRDGVSLFTKRVWRKLVLKADENSDASTASLATFVDGLSPQYRDIRKTAIAADIPVFSVDRFEEAADMVQSIGAGIGLFTGGGMVPPVLLNSFTRGVINTHMGHLPQYKGMDVVQAPILEGRTDSIGLTTHFMKSALDAGPTLGRFTIPMAPYRTLGAQRNALSAIMPILLLDSALGLGSGRLEAIPQPPLGRQYYFVHKTLSDVISNYFQVCYDPGAFDAAAECIDIVLEDLLQ